MATIDVDKLRAYLLEYCGTAMFSGFPAAFIDVIELCKIAERLGIDLRRFEVR